MKQRMQSMAGHYQMMLPDMDLHLMEPNSIVMKEAHKQLSLVVEAGWDSQVVK